MREAYEKDNAVTREMNRISELNRQLKGGQQPHSFSAGGAPRVVTAAMTEPLLPDEEKKRRDELLSQYLGEEPPAQVVINGSPRMTAREYLAPRLPDFSKIQSIDLVNNTIVVDSFPIPLPPGDAEEIKSYILRVATDFISSELAKVMAGIKIASGGKIEGDKVLSEVPTNNLTKQTRKVYKRRGRKKKAMDSGPSRTTT